MLVQKFEDIFTWASLPITDLTDRHVSISRFAIFLVIFFLVQIPHAIAQPAASEPSLSWVEEIVKNGQIGSGYKHGQFPSEGNKTHPGIDIGGGCGLQVVVAADGEVVRVVDQDDENDYLTLGNAVVVRHADEIDGRPTFTIYLHMRDKPSVGLGRVTKGTTLGYTGEKGFADGCHLHFEVRHFAGIRNVYHPTARQIYLPPISESETWFSQDWSDPELWIKEQVGNWIFQPVPNLVLNRGDESGKFRLSNDGKSYFANHYLSTIPSVDRAILYVFFSPNRKAAFTMMVDETFGGLSGTTIDLENERVRSSETFTMEHLMKYGAGRGVIWSLDSSVFLVPLPAGDNRTSLLLVDTASGIGKLVLPATLIGENGIYDNPPDVFGWKPIETSLELHKQTLNVDFVVWRCLGGSERRQCEESREELLTVRTPLIASAREPKSANEGQHMPAENSKETSVKYSAEEIRNWYFFDEAGGNEFLKIYLSDAMQVFRAQNTTEILGRVNSVSQNDPPEKILADIEKALKDFVDVVDLIALLGAGVATKSDEYGELYTLYLINRARTQNQTASFRYEDLDRDGFKKASSTASAFHTIGIDPSLVEKWTHVDGREYVYTIDSQADPKLIFDGINNGTYNYCTDFVCHTIMDVMPWVLWGATINDTATPNERAIAFRNAFTAMRYVKKTKGDMEKWTSFDF